MFNIKSFRAALNVMTAKTEERADAMAAFLSGAAHDAAHAHLMEGAGCLPAFMEAIHKAGKGALAVKMRKAFMNADHSAIASWGKVSCVKTGFAFNQAADFTGGNNRKCDDRAERIAACESWADAIASSVRDVFAPAAPGEKAGPFDFLSVSEKALEGKFEKATFAQLGDALKAAQALADTILLRMMASAEEAAEAAPEAAAEAAPEEAAEAAPEAAAAAAAPEAAAAAAAAAAEAAPEEAAEAAPEAAAAAAPEAAPEAAAAAAAAAPAKAKRGRKPVAA
ncbi:MAG: hypothetical protein WC322_05740 [Candidatus Paceibacterota bacterium]|jgi:chemotaxis protein histidine kinase CheA